MAYTAGWGVAGAATTMLVRRATRRMMHERGGAPRLPGRARHSTFGVMLLLAALTGAALAFADVLREQKKHVTKGQIS